MFKRYDLALSITAAFLFCGLTTLVNAAPPTSPPGAGASLKLSDFETTNPDCTAAPACDDYNVVSATQAAWVHTISFTAYFSTPGDGYCSFRAGLYDIDGGTGSGNYANLAQVVATSASPANYFFALPTPIMIDPADELYVIGLNSGTGACRGEAHFGVRIATDDD